VIEVRADRAAVRRSVEAAFGLTDDWGAGGPEWMVLGDVPPGHVIHPAPFA
jgi:hypothetical protein